MFIAVMPMPLLFLRYVYFSFFRAVIFDTLFHTPFRHAGYYAIDAATPLR